jgi:hypothetical protein
MLSFESDFFRLERLRTFCDAFFGFLNVIRHVVGLPWMSDQLVADLYRHWSTQLIKHKDKHPHPSWIRSSDPRNQTAKTYAFDLEATGTGLNPATSVWSNPRSANHSESFIAHNCVPGSLSTQIADDMAL